MEITAFRFGEIAILRDAGAVGRPAVVPVDRKASHVHVRPITAVYVSGEAVDLESQSILPANLQGRSAALLRYGLVSRGEPAYQLRCLPLQPVAELEAGQ